MLILCMNIHYHATLEWLTLLHSERPKLYTILAFLGALSAIGLMMSHNRCKKSFTRITLVSAKVYHIYALKYLCTVVIMCIISGGSVFWVGWLVVLALKAL